MLAVTSSCNLTSRGDETQEPCIELKRSIHLTKCQAYHLIANDSITEGIHLLDSLWNTYHVDRNMLQGLASAYYKKGDKDSAFHWLKYEEQYLDSLIRIEPKPELYNDLCLIKLILEGRNAAEQLTDKIGDKMQESARKIFEEYPDGEELLKLLTDDMCNSYKSGDYVR